MKVIRLLAISLIAIPFVLCSKSHEKPAPDLGKGLLVYYMFHEYQTTDSADTLPAFTTSGTFNWSLDRHSFVSSIHFNGGSATVPVPNWKASPITISVWVYAFDDDVTKYFLGTNDGVIGLFQNNTKLGIAVSHPYTNSAKAEGLNNSKWTHMAGIFDGKKIYVYINGELKGTQDHAGNPKDITEITMGSVNNSKWNGNIDDLRIYNRVLSAEEIALLAKY